MSTASRSIGNSERFAETSALRGGPHVQASKLKPNWNSLKGWRREVDFLAGGFWQNAMAELRSDWGERDPRPPGA